MDDYSFILYIKDLPALEAEIFRLQKTVELGGSAQAAAMIRTAYGTLLSTLQQVSVRVAEVSAVKIREKEASTRVRPPTAHSDGVSLEDHFQSDPLSALPGSVGVINESVLYEEVPWWWTQEEGYAGHVGRVVHGHFYDSGFINPSDPQATSSRVHPLFRPESGPPMVIQRPIPARHFILETLPEIDALWRREIANAKKALLKEVNAAIVIADRQFAARGVRRRR